MMIEAPIIDKRVSLTIDFWRGTLAILVAFSHSIGRAKVMELDVPPGFEMFTTGGYWVMGFFVLSGLCVNWSVMRSLAKKEFGILSFLWARFTRIAPIFYIALAVAMVVFQIFQFHWYFEHAPPREQHSFGTILGAIFFLQNITGIPSGYGPSWSITNEMVYYLIWPIALYLGALRLKRAFVFSLLFYLGICTVFYILWHRGGQQNEVILAIWVIAISGLLWLAGALAAIFWERIRTSKLVPLFGVLWPVPLLGGYVLYFFISTRELSLVLTVLFVYPLACAGIIMACFAPVRLSEKWCRRLGYLSYPLYLLHAPVLYFFMYLCESASITNPYLVICILFFGCLIVGFFPGIYLETYFLSKRREWLGRRTLRQVEQMKSREKRPASSKLE